MFCAWRVFRISTEPAAYVFASVNRRNNEARAHIACCIISVDLDLQIQTYRPYTEPVPLKYGKLTTKYLWEYG